MKIEKKSTKATLTTEGVINMFVLCLTKPLLTNNIVKHLINTKQQTIPVIVNDNQA